MPTTKKYTMQDALAFAEITGKVGEARANTIEAVKPFIRELKGGEVRLNAQGRKLAQRSRLMKAHEYLSLKGFAPVQNDRMSREHIIYKNEKKEAIVTRGRVVRNGTIEQQFMNG